MSSHDISSFPLFLLGSARRQSEPSAQEPQPPQEPRQAQRAQRAQREATRPSEGAAKTAMLFGFLAEEK